MLQAVLADLARLEERERIDYDPPLYGRPSLTYPGKTGFTVGVARPAVAWRGSISHFDHLRGGCLARIPPNPYTVPVRPKAVVFDLIDTLIERNDSVSHASVQAMCADPGYARKRIPQIVPGEDLDRGTVTFRQLHKLLVHEVGLEADYETFVAASMSGYRPTIDGVETILDALAGDYQLALLSNLNAVDWAYCKAHHRALLAKVEPPFRLISVGDDQARARNLPPCRQRARRVTLGLPARRRPASQRQRRSADRLGRHPFHVR